MKTHERTICCIAHEILDDWKKPYFGAVPYIEAMMQMENAKDNFGLDSGKSIVLYFLSNATTWRGAEARRIKLELKGMING